MHAKNVSKRFRGFWQSRIANFCKKNLVKNKKKEWMVRLYFFAKFNHVLDPTMAPKLVQKWPKMV